ncbi:DUF4190 domain-containing protein [Microbacterium sp.]|uniref:DUF4190 domain-containing protein n=1 Tax=Microbacterium sp. TaxID=51671 RepID=UPI003C781F02
MSDPSNPSPAPEGQNPAPRPAYGEYAPPPAPPAYDSAPAYTAPAYQSAPAYDGGAPSNGSYPGKTLGIVALIVAIFANLIGLILGIVALVQSKKAGYKNGFAVAAIIVGSVLFVIGLIIGIMLLVWLTTQGADLVNQVNACLDDPTGSVVYNGITMSCEEVLSNSNR